MQLNTSATLFHRLSPPYRLSVLRQHWRTISVFSTNSNPTDKAKHDQCATNRGSGLQKFNFGERGLDDADLEILF